MQNFFLRFVPRSIRNKIETNQGLQKILANINWLFFDKILSLCIGLFVVAWIARYLGPENFGILNYALAFVALFSVLSTLGLGNIPVRNIVREPFKKNQILGSTFFLKFLGSLILFASTFIVISFLRPDDYIMRIFVAIVAFGYLFKSFNAIDLWFQSQVQSKYTVFARSAAFIVVAIIKVILILTKAPLIAFVCMFGVELVLAAIGLFIFYQLKSGNSLFKWKVRFDTIKELLKDSWPLIFSGVAVVIYMKIDQIMVGQMIGNKELGYYSAAVRLSEIWYFIPVAILGSVFPALVRAKKKSKKLYLGRLQKLYDFSAWFPICIAIIITFTSGFIINLLYGSEYSASAIVLSIHIWSGVLVFLGNVITKHMVVENLTKIIFFRTTVGATVNILLNLIFIPKYGIIGAAVATLMSFFISIMSLSIPRKTRINIKMFFNAFNIFRIFKVLRSVYISSRKQ